MVSHNEQNGQPHSYAEAAAEPPRDPDLVVAGPEDKESRILGTKPSKPITKNGQITPPTEYEGVGKDDAPRSPTRRGTSHKRKTSSTSDASANGTKRKSENKGNNVVYEKFGNGGQLTSVKPADKFEEHNRVDRKEQKKVLDNADLAGTSGELSFRSDWFRRSPIWSLFASYFPARLHRVEELPPTRKYVFGYHPHGIISHGAFASFATEALGFSQLFPGITNSLLTLDSNFRLPLYREYALRLGLSSVSKESCENILSKGGPNGEGMGRAITVVIGGARESLDAQPNVMKLVLKRRKGFVKIAIRQGADLVPVIGFGENELYEQFDAEGHPWIHKLQLLVKKIAGFTVPLFHARGVFNYDVGMMPYRRPMNIVVGRPIKIMQQINPDPAYVDEVHQNYMDGLQQIWDDWKDTFAKERQGEMQIVE